MKAPIGKKRLVIDNFLVRGASKLLSLTGYQPPEESVHKFGYFDYEEGMRRGVKRKRVYKSYRRHVKKKVDSRVKSQKKTPARPGSVKNVMKSKKFRRRDKKKLKFERKIRNIIARTTGLKTGIITATSSLNSVGPDQATASMFMNGGALAVTPYLTQLLGSVDPGAAANITLKLEMSELEVTIINANEEVYREESYTFNPTTGVVPAHDYIAGGANNSNNEVYMKVYHVIARRDADDTNGASPSAVWSTFFAAEATLGVPLGTASTINTYGVTPFDAPAFCADWKILNVQNIVLKPGGIHKLILRSKKSRWITAARIDQNAFIRNVTEGFIVTIHGGPSYSTGALTNASITYSQTARYHFRHIEDDVVAEGHA